MIRVLIVDDDKLARKGLISIMPWQAYGMQIVGEAANGAKALEFLGGHETDLAFVDLAMPIMSGLELMQTARGKYPRLRFVVLTFHEDFELVQSAFRLGALDYISKIRMETEDCNALFTRIRENFRTSGPNAGEPESNGPEVPAEPVDSGLTETWTAFHWLYDEAEFARLCRQTAASPLDTRQLDMLFACLSEKAAAVTGLTVGPWRAHDSREAALNDIQALRERIHRLAAGDICLGCAAVCILRATHFIRQQLAEPLDADEAAAKVGMSRSYFCVCFKKLVGVTFNKYLRRERIREAARLLTDTAQTVTRISQAVGYGDVKYFSHIFQQETGSLPSEYRSNLRTRQRIESCTSNK